MSIYCQNVQVCQKVLIQVLDNKAGDSKREMTRFSFLCPLSVVAISTSVYHLKSYLKRSLVIFMNHTVWGFRKEELEAGVLRFLLHPLSFPDDGFVPRHCAAPSCGGGRPWAEKDHWVQARGAVSHGMTRHLCSECAQFASCLQSTVSRFLVFPFSRGGD